jgi:hypothetical protein
MLMRPEYREKIDPKWKKRIEQIVRYIVVFRFLQLLVWTEITSTYTIGAFVISH